MPEDIATHPQISKDKKEPLIHVKVCSPFKTYFDDFAKSVSAVNLVGPFDVLPLHKNFISLLSPCDLVIRTEENTTTLPIFNGILLVQQGDCTVFLDV